jgi:hypothetical protein
MTTVQQAHSMVAVDGTLFVDGEPVCPLCLEDEGSEYCTCTPALAIIESAKSTSPMHERA